VANYKDTLGVCCSLSKPVQRRLKALKRLQRDAFEIEVKFYEELHQLEHKYENLYSSLYDKVRATDYFLLPHHTKTVLRPFFRDHPGEPVPEENFWTLWCKGRLTEADTQTIWLGATPSGLSSAHLHHSNIFTGRMPFLSSNHQCQSTEDI